MFNLYFASAIDVYPEKAFKQIEKFKRVLSKYKVNVFGAGMNKDSPIIDEHATLELKGVICAYDYRMIRQCDILLVVVDQKTFCPGTCMELEYGRKLGLYIIVLSLGGDFIKNIFIETFASKIIYSIKDLEVILENVVGKKNE